jgi:hypothetical protein
VRIGALLAALLALALLVASPASAAYETVGNFAGILKPPAEPGVFPEEVQLAGVSGMAVNQSGAGGVKPGTVYAVAENLEGTRVAMYEPKEGGLEFVEAWGFAFEEGGPYERCGPLVGTSCEARVEAQVRSIDVDVDQTTGNVYMFLERSTVGASLIIEYKADGSKEITRFGKRAPEGKKTAETPSEIHRSGPGGIAVNGAGEVYVFDVDPPADNFYHRLMVFKPQSPEDYEHYVYAGTEHDVAAGFQGETRYSTTPVFDSVGDIYVAEDDFIQKLDPTHPSDPAICSFEFAKGGITSLTVNPQTGEPYFFSLKSPKRVHRLSACNEAGEFVETEAFKATPERADLSALAFDPVRQLEASRPPGVLYGGAPGAEPSTGGKGEPGQSSLGYIFAQSKEVAPKVESQSVSHVTAATARLAAKVNPKGAETRYVFQYETEAAYKEAGESFTGAAEAPLGGADLLAGQAGVDVAAGILGLEPDTAYRWRTVATSHCSSSDKEKVCEGTGPAQSFRTFPAEAAGLADHRVWELVSPPDKNGGQVFVADSRAGLGTCGHPDCKPGSSYGHPMQSRPDGEVIVYAGNPFSPPEGAISENEYISRRNSKTGWQTTNLTPSLLNGGAGYQAFDAALIEGVFAQQLSPQLSPEAPSEYPNLYRQPTAGPATLNPLLGSEPPNRLPGGTGGFEHLVLTFSGGSVDFSHLFFEANDALTEETAFAPEAIDGGGNKSNLYERVGGQLRLVNVLPGNTETKPGASFGTSAARAFSADGSRVFWSDEAGQVYVRLNGESTEAIPDPGKFLAASADGSKVLLSSGHLYDLETEATTDLSEGKGGFQRILGRSEDLSRLYFLDTAVLTGEEENDRGAKAEVGKENLYAWNEGTTRFIATRLAGDSNNAEASPDGGFLAFLSVASLTGYDNTGPCLAGFNPISPCVEVFLYDSATQTLTCASCNPTGEHPLGSSELRQILGAVASMPQPRYLTDEGRLYFDSRDSLSRLDTNEGVEDVYQYEPEGVGTCEHEAGCVSLISAGHEAIDSNFLAMDEDGKNVFFTTRDQLSLKDHDDLVDLYDAREDGGIPGETEVARTECEGEACLPAVNAPNDPTPGSSSFEGAGNVDERKAKKHKKKKHAKKHKSHKRSQGRAAKHNRGGVK